MLCEAYSRDDTDPVNLNYAKIHLENFYNYLKFKVQHEKYVEPRLREKQIT